MTVPLLAPLLVGGAIASAPWWLHHRARAVTRAPAAQAGGVPELWANHIADSGGKLPGSRCTFAETFEHGTTYRVDLVPGRQHFQMALGAIPQISSGLLHHQPQLMIERWPGGGPTELRLRVITASPIETTVPFGEPRHRGGNIVLGPYGDGLSDAIYRLYTRNSMWGGFILGSQGSGKSRLLECIALTAMAMGNTVVFYFDGQNGASSAMLWKYATRRAGVGEAGDLLDVLEAIMRDRQRYNVEHELAGFTPSPARPGILVIVDEAHGIFPLAGPRWAGMVLENRKLGGAVLAGDQTSHLATFANLDGLRSGLCAGNTIVLRTASKQAGHLLPGFALDPYELPPLPGYGYTVAAKGATDVRTAPFRGRYLHDADDVAADPGLTGRTVEDWFRLTPQVPLDEAALAAERRVLDARAASAARREAAVEEARRKLDATSSTTGPPAVAVGDRAEALIDAAEGATMDDRIRELFDRQRVWELPRMYAALGGDVKVQTVRGSAKRLTDSGWLVRVRAGVYERAV